MYEINQERQLELLKRLLFAWDAQWFLKSAAAFGPDEALKVNGRTRSAFGRLEMKAMLALLGKTQANGLADALEIIKAYHALAFNHNPILSNVSQASDDNRGGRGKALLSLGRCAVLDNAKRSVLPLNPSETNCVYCQMLWLTWLENLLPDAQIEAVFVEGSNPNAPHGVLSVTSFGANTTLAASANAIEAHELGPNAYLPTPAQPVQAVTYPPNYPPTPAIPATPPPTATPLIGGNEIGGNQPSIQFGSLRQRTEQNRPPENLAPPNLTRKEAVLPPESPPLVPDMRLDPYTGKPLFTGGMEKQIQAGVSGTKKKNFNLISRVMLSKEAQDLLKKSADNPEPLAQPMTLANTLDAILQRLLLEENKARPGSINQTVRFANTPYGDLQIQVGQSYFSGVDEVPPSRIKELLQQTIINWQQND